MGRLLDGVPVLVVEDDEASRKLTVLLLEQEGAEVRTASSGEQALDVLRTFRPRAVILDLILPGMGGLALVKAARADPRMADVAFLAVSAASGPESQRATLAAGCAGYFEKPIDVEDFAALVARHLGVKSEHD